MKTEINARAEIGGGVAVQRLVSCERTTQIIREECERRLATVKNGVECAIFAIEHANPQLADQYLDDVVRYGQLAKLDTQELQRRLHGSK